MQVDQAKEVVRLGSGSGTFSVIAPDAEARALEVIKRLVGVAEARDADLVRLVATSAVREAQNKNSFVRKGRGGTLAHGGRFLQEQGKECCLEAKSVERERVLCTLCALPS